MVQRLKKSIGAFLVILVIGIWGFMTFEELSFLDALYVTVVTLATVGYGDITPVTPEGRIFVIFFIVAGFSVTYYTLIMVVSLLLEGQIRDLLGRRGMERSISKMQDHIIVCGAGKVGSNVVQSLLEKKNPLWLSKKMMLFIKPCVKKKYWCSMATPPWIASCCRRAWQRPKESLPPCRMMLIMSM